MKHRILLFSSLIVLFAVAAWGIAPTSWGNGGDNTLYFPAIQRARPGLRDMVGLTTAQLPTQGNKDIVIMYYSSLVSFVTFDNDQHDDSPSWNSSKTLILARTYPVGSEPEQGNLVVIEGDYYLSTTTTPITANTNPKRDFQWSPADDISYLETTTEGRTDLWIAPAGTLTSTMVISDVVNYRWSPSGSTIAYTVMQSDTHDVYLANADGTNPILLTDASVDDLLVDWIAGGSELLTIRNDGVGSDDLWAVAQDGSSERQVTSQDGDEAPLSVSPDGTMLAYLQYRSNGFFDLFVQPVAETAPVPATPLWFCPDDPECYIGDVAWASTNDQLAWRVFTENPATELYEWQLLYSGAPYTTTYEVAISGTPEGTPVWAEASDWLIYNVIQPDLTTSNIFAREFLNYTPASAEETITTGDADYRAVEWRRLYDSERATP